MAKDPVYRHDPINKTMSLTLLDKMEILKQPIGQEVVFDGWCIYSVVRYLLEVSGIHLSFLHPATPLYIPPGADSQAPYGPAGYDCPYYSLARGTGNNPKYKCLPDQSALSILTELVMDMSEQMGIRYLPYRMGFTPDGLFFFSVFDPFQTPVVASYSDYDPYGKGQMIGSAEWHTSTENLRTTIDMQGIDALTNELLHNHIEMSDLVKQLCGYPVKMIERSPRWQSEQQMIDAGNGMTIPASIPELSGYFRVPYDENTVAGDVVYVRDFENGVNGHFVIEALRSNIYLGADGTKESVSELGVRSIVNYI